MQAPSFASQMPLADVSSTVYETFLEVTRYPKEILQPGSNLEEDLGIDSVKLVEIFSILVERFDLPTDIQFDPAELTTIDVISNTIFKLQHTGGTNRSTPGGNSTLSNGAGSGMAANGAGNGTANGAGNGTANGAGNGTANGAGNGMANGAGNGMANGAGNGMANGSGTDTVQLKDNTQPKVVDAEENDFSVGQSIPDLPVPAVATATQNELTLEELKSSVYRTFLEVTRYPEEILKPDSNLEEDLGIDSVKLVEIFSILVEKFNLPTDVQINPAELSTIDAISLSIYELQSNGQLTTETTGNQQIPVTSSSLSNEQKTSSADALASRVETLSDESKLVAPSASDVGTDTAQNQPAAGAATAGTDIALSEQEVKDSVYQTFLEVTRYPEEILRPESNLEEDLGIDSVKLVEIFSILVEKFKLPTDVQIDPAELSSIDVISTTIHRMQGTSENTAVRVAEAGIVVDQKQDTPPATRNMQHLEEAKTSFPNAGSFAVSKEQPSATDRAQWHKPLKGKVGIISGSGRGLGKVVAHHLAKLGATVVVNSFHSRDEGVRTADEIVQEGGDAYHIWGSFANLDHLHQIFDQIEEKFGELDFFISNASNGMLAELKDITPAQMEKGFRTNIIGFQQGVIRSTPLMQKKGGGKIIAMSSPAAHGYVEYFGLMGALKAAVESMVRSFAVELEQHDIQVNTVSPGPVYGDLLKKWPDSDKLVSEWESRTPHKRLCTAEDVAETIAFMVSDSAHMFNGSCVVLDGGISVRGW